MKKVFSTLFIIILMITGSYAQKKNSTADYFMQKADEAMKVDDLAAASNYYLQAWELDHSMVEAEFWYAAITIDSIPMKSYVFLCDVIDKAKDKKILSAAYHLRGSLFFKQEQYNYAIEDYKKAIAIYKKNELAYLQLAKCYSTLDDYVNSNTVLMKLLKINKENLDAKIEFAKNLGQEGKYQESIELCNEIIKKRNDVSNAYAVRAASYSFTNEYTQAANDIVTALILPDDDIAFNFLKSCKGEMAEALQLALRKKMNENPNDPRWPYYCALNAESNEQYSKALQYYSAAGELDDFPLFNAKIAQCHTTIGNYRQAINYWNLVTKEVPDDLGALYYRIVAYDELGITDSAYLDAAHMLSLDSNNTEILEHVGYLYMINNSYEAALPYFAAALGIDSTSFTSYFYTGKCYYYLNKPEEARRYFVFAIKYGEGVSSNYFTPLAYYFLGNRNEAKKLIEQKLKDFPGSSSSYFSACLYSLMGESVKALECLQNTLDFGLVRWNLLNKEPMLENIRHLPEFEAMIEKAKKAKE